MGAASKDTPTSRVCEPSATGSIVLCPSIRFHEEEPDHALLSSLRWTRLAALERNISARSPPIFYPQQLPSSRWVSQLNFSPARLCTSGQSTVFVVVHPDKKNENMAELFR